ncbi:hypothetical protein, partial [Streptomyces sp. NPDC059003]
PPRDSAAHFGKVKTQHVVVFCGPHLLGVSVPLTPASGRPELKVWTLVAHHAPEAHPLRIDN